MREPSVSIPPPRIKFTKEQIAAMKTAQKETFLGPRPEEEKLCGLGTGDELMKKYIWPYKGYR